MKLVSHSFEVAYVTTLVASLGLLLKLHRATITVTFVGFVIATSIGSTKIFVVSTVVALDLKVDHWERS